MHKDDLLRAALAARDNAYSPYSKFSVGAALLTTSGRIFVGCNVENLSLGLTICAERSCVTQAVAAGERKYDSIYIVADTDQPIVPCGACRQFLAEFEPELVIYSKGRAEQAQFRLSDLLPRPTQGIMGHD